MKIVTLMNRLHDIFCHYYILKACCEGSNLFYNDVCLIDSIVFNLVFM